MRLRYAHGIVASLIAASVEPVEIAVLLRRSPIKELAFIKEVRRVAGTVSPLLQDPVGPELAEARYLGREVVDQSLSR